MKRERHETPNDAGRMPRVRCAIYTRKSTEEGLEQDFNSLDAQRESAENYIASQAGEGWVCRLCGWRISTTEQAVTQ